MAMAIQSNRTSRFTDLFDEPVDHLLSPIKGYQDKPLLPLLETIKPISGFFKEIEDYVFVALHNCQTLFDGLTQDESASIHLYTMQFHDGASLYVSLNQSLRNENRDELKPWFSFLKLFLTALYKLPSQNRTVWRGIRDVNLSSKYKKGSNFAWWGVSSCTADIDILESNQFLGKQGQRTLFSIECINGKSVGNHSYFKNKEKEIILMPGSYFEVIGQLNSGSDLHIIQLKEIPPPIALVKPPFLKLNSSNSVSIVKKGSIFSQILIRVRSKKSISDLPLTKTPFKSNTKWKQRGITIVGGNDQGNELNQLFHPYGISIDDEETLYIADSHNHRIVEWKSSASHGRIIAGGNKQGNQINQLSHPRNIIIDKENDSYIIADIGNRRVMRWSCHDNTNGDIIISDIDCWGLAMNNDGDLYVSDYERNEVRRWKRGDNDGIIVAGGKGEGEKLNQLNCPTFIFVDDDYSLYISDCNNNRIMKWLKDAKEGIVVAGGHGCGSSLKQLSYPQEIIVDELGQIYVADYINNRVMRWCKESKTGTIIVGGNGQGKQANQFYQPIGLSFDRQGNLYVGDSLNHRIQKFEIDLE